MGSPDQIVSSGQAKLEGKLMATAIDQAIIRSPGENEYTTATTNALTVPFDPTIALKN
jgi:hypothetical protein